MKIGFGSPLSGQIYPMAKDLGCDYIEANFFKLSNNDDLEKHLQLIDTYKTPVRNANAALGSLIAVGPSRLPLEAFEEYFERAFKNASLLGVKTVVLGSGASRKVPEDYPFEKGFEEFTRVASLMGDISQKYGILTVIEPLCKKETNIINTVREGAEFVRNLNHPNVRLLADSYHMRAESEDFSVIRENADILRHFHIAEAQVGNTEIRLMPDRKDAFDTKSYVEILKEIGYDGDLTIEASSRGGDFVKDLEESVKAVREWTLQ